MSVDLVMTKHYMDLTHNHPVALQLSAQIGLNIFAYLVIENDSIVL